MTARIILIALLASVILSSCKKEANGPKLIFKFHFDSTQVRLNNLGQPAVMPAGHAAQSPRFNTMGAHYIEMAPNMFTSLGTGEVLWLAPETTAGGANAIDFDQENPVGQDQEFFSIPLSEVSPGTYEYLRVSLAYQNYDIHFKAAPGGVPYYGVGTIASFVGFNTYIQDYLIKNTSITVNGNRAQGYWGFEYNIAGITGNTSGQAPPGATTVPNPLFATSPIAPGSCVVTAAFANAAGTPTVLNIGGAETEDIVVTVNISTNNSFEWIDVIPDGVFQPDAGETVVDMGVRGMIPKL